MYFRSMARNIWAIIYWKNLKCFLWRLATSFLKETFLVYPTLTAFTQRKKKTYVWCEWFISAFTSEYNSLYPLSWKKFDCTSIKTTEHEFILLYAKAFNERLHKQLVKIWKEKRCEHFFNTFNLWYEKKEKTKICFVVIKIFGNSHNTTIFTQNS